MHARNLCKFPFQLSLEPRRKAQQNNVVGEVDGYASAPRPGGAEKILVGLVCFTFGGQTAAGRLHLQPSGDRHGNKPPFLERYSLVFTPPPRPRPTQATIFP